MLWFCCILELSDFEGSFRLQKVVKNSWEWRFPEKNRRTFQWYVGCLSSLPRNEMRHPVPWFAQPWWVGGQLWGESFNPFVKKCHEHFFKSFRIAKIGQLQNNVSFVLDKILHPEKVQKYFQTWKLTMIWKVNTCWPLVNKFPLYYLIYDNKVLFLWDSDMWG